MIKNDYSLEPQASNEVTGGITNKGARDLIVLRYMVQKVRMVLHTMEQPVAVSSPLSYSLEVRHNRQQRIILYDPQVLLRNTSLSFVGFVSGKQKIVDPSIDNEMQRIDALLTKELVNAPGLLCYSSLELRTDKWYNLVLLADFNIKTHLKNSAIHCYGAYQLAARYYEWIRLHSGIIADGLKRNTLLLQKTKYYTCQTPEPRFTVREIIYNCH
jgi:hypothetical protein